MTTFRQEFRVQKVDAGLRLVRGWAVVSSENGVPYVDTQGDHIPTGPLLHAVVDFMKVSRKADTMHDEVQKGVVVESVVIDDEWCAAYGATMSKRGWAVGVQFDQPEFDKFAKGEFQAFSIGGHLDEADDIPDGECPACRQGHEGACS